MRDNFRPNVRLTTNILMVIGTFLIAINLASIGKQDKKFIQRRDDCAIATAAGRPTLWLIDKYGLGVETYEYQNKEEFSESRKLEMIRYFCDFYK